MKQFRLYANRGRPVYGVEFIRFTLTPRLRPKRNVVYFYSANHYLYQITLG